MSVQIQNQLDRLLLMDSLDLVLYGMQLRQFLDIVPIPWTVQVVAESVTTIVAQDHSVDVDHRNAVDVEAPEQELVFRGDFSQLAHDLVHDEGTHTFTGMLASK